MDIAKLPFNKVLGIKADGRQIVLVPHMQHLNHVETVHAVVIFGVAEAASGLCLLDRFPEFTQSFVAVLRNATTKYRRPAIADSELRGTGTLNDDTAVEFLATLQSRGRAMVDIPVSVMQDGLEIFSGNFTWFAGRK